MYFGYPIKVIDSQGVWRLTRARFKEQSENHQKYLGVEAELGTSDDSEEMELVKGDRVRAE